jgi:phospholipid transport system substrate-binding protein
MTIGIVCCLISVGFSTHTAGANTQTPEQAIKTFLEIVGSMEFPASDPARHAGLLREANAYLDLETMGAEALRDHWATVPSEEKKVFFDLLWKLVEAVAYPQNQNLMNNEQIVYGETVQTGDGFQVPVSARKEAEAPAASISYHLSKKEGQWKIDDVILDDVSLIEDFKYQFNKIIAESKFPGLLEKMRKRLREAQEKNKNEKV